MKKSQVSIKKDVYGKVIKPAKGAGSRGVYLVLELDRIRDVKRSVWLKDWNALEASLRDDLESGRVKDDKWIVEELIFEDKK